MDDSLSNHPASLTIHGFTQYAALRFIGLAFSKPFLVSVTVLRSQYMPNRKHRRLTDVDGYIHDPPPLDLSDAMARVRSVHGTLGLFRGTTSDFAATLVHETVEPVVTSVACDLASIDDSLMPVDHHNPFPITAVSICATVVTDMLIAPLRAVSFARQLGLRPGSWSALATPEVVSATLVLSSVNACFEVLTPLLIDRILGVSELYNPVMYVFMEFAARNLRDLVSLPLDTIKCRLYLQALSPLSLGHTISLVSLPPIPYSSVSDCFFRILQEEGGCIHEYRVAKNKDDSPISSFNSGLVHYLAPLYHGLSLRFWSNVGFLAVRLLTYSLDLNESEF